MITIIVLAVIMALVGLIAAALPLWIKLDTHSLGEFASGVILGSAFAIVIPEGLSTMGDHGAGYALLAGYVTMLAVEILTHTSSRAAVSPASASRASIDLGSYSQPNERAGEPSHKKVNTTALGMIIHSLADGIALGSTSSATSSSLQLTVFASIILHKAPASFSLTSALLAEGESPKSVKWNAAIFALIGPVFAVLIALALEAVAQPATNLNWWAGCALTFSGGTFAFVAAHIQHHALGGRALSNMGYVRLGVGLLLPVVATMFPDSD